MRPVPCDKISDYLDNLLQYINKSTNINDDVDDFIKLAIIHCQFETIHPFTDGNGRTGRILIVLFLLLKNYLDEPILYLSAYINTHKDLYYQYLQECNKQHIYENLICFILDAIIDTAKQTMDKIYQIEQCLKTDKNTIKNDTILKDIKQPRELLDCIYSGFWITQEQSLDKLDITRPTIRKYFNRLCEIDILEKKKINREARFYNKKLVNIFRKK